MPRMLLWIPALALCFLALPASGQIALSLELNRKVYMQYELILAKVTFRNDSGKTMVFGADDRLQGKLFFDLTGPDRDRIAPLPGKQLSLIGFVLGAGETREVIVPVSRYYPIRRLGVYKGHAYITHPLLKEVFRSNDCKFEVNAGVPLFSRTVGQPDVLNRKSDKTVEERTYVLKRMMDQDLRYCYLSIEDAKKVYAVMRLGRDFSLERYRCEVDNLSNLHVLLQVMPRIYHYLCINTDGRIEARRFYKNDKRSPSLFRDPATGRVSVVGGLEAIPGVDFEQAESGTPKGALPQPAREPRRVRP